MNLPFTDATHSGFKRWMLGNTFSESTVIKNTEFYLVQRNGVKQVLSVVVNIHFEVHIGNV